MLKYVMTIHNSRRDGNCYWAFTMTDGDKTYSGTISGGDSNIDAIRRYWTVADDWDRSIHVVREELPIRQFNAMVKTWPYAGCAPEDIAAAAKAGLGIVPKITRADTLMPGGIPRWIRCYDKPAAVDRYTVVYTGATAKRASGGQVPYVGMSENPCHPQGFGQHGSSDDPIDVDAGGGPPAMGKTCNLGTRVAFADLPEPCRQLVIRDYRELWGLSEA